MKRLSLRSVLTPLLLATVVLPLRAQFWERVELLPALNIRSIAVGYDGEVFVGSSAYGVYRSTDLGETWERSISGLTTMSVDGIAIDTGGGVFLSTYAGGVFRSSDHGLTWAAANDGLTDLFIRPIAITSAGTLFVGAEDEGIFMSTDRGGSWTNVGGTTTRDEVYALLAVDATTVLAGVKYLGICRSTDGGSNWTRTGGFQSPRSFAMTVDGEVVAACFGSGVQYSDNSGGTWAARNTGIGTNDVNLVHSFGGHLLATTFDSRVFRSSDRGLSWAQLDDGLDGREPQVFATLQDGRLLAGTNAGLYRSIEIPATVVAASRPADGVRLVTDRASGVLRPSGVPADGARLVLHDMIGRRIAVSAELPQISLAGLPNAPLIATLVASNGTVLGRWVVAP